MIEIRRKQKEWTWMGIVSATVALGVLGVSLVTATATAQTPPGKKAAARGKGKTVAKKTPPNAGDPLAAKAKEKADATSYHFKLRLHAYDDVPLTASYYPAPKLDTTAPLVLLVHEKDRSSKDFEDPIPDLKGVGMAEHLQGLGFGVLDFDLRGYGANTRKAMTDKDWRAMVDDMQAAYEFLVDRHNRGEGNIAKLGVIALGEGANLVAAWVEQPGGAVSSEGRTADVGALALISPMPEGEGYTFSRLMNTVSKRVPVLLATGERDAISHAVVKNSRPAVEKTRQNKVELFPSSLHGYKLLRLEPRAPGVITRFLESTIRAKSAEWEPRYNLYPVSYTDIQLVRHTKPGDEKAKEKEKEKEAPKAKEAEKEKEKEKAKEKDKEEVPPPPPKAEGKGKL